MGCDIHPYFERKIPTGWEPIWEPTPELNYWWERIIEETYKDLLSVEVVKTIIDDSSLDLKGDEDEDDLNYMRLEKYYKSLPLDEVKEKFISNPNIILEWNYPKLDNKRYGCEISGRNYWWFEIINGVRGTKDCLFESNKGIPTDSCQNIKREKQYWDGDGHSHSWLMVSEIIEVIEKYDQNHPTKDEDQRYINFPQYKWLKTYIKAPENTRMVFWFDN